MHARTRTHTTYDPMVYLPPVLAVGLAPFPPPPPSWEQAGCSGLASAPQVEETLEGAGLSGERRKRHIGRHNTDDAAQMLVCALAEKERSGGTG